MTVGVGCKGGLKDGLAQKQVGREEMSGHGGPMLRAQNQAADHGPDPLLPQAGPGERGRPAEEGLGQRPGRSWAPTCSASTLRVVPDLENLESGG